MWSQKSLALGLAACLSLAGAAAAAPAADTVYAGIDTWITRGDGSSFTDFAGEPIPAGFFCAGSAPFTGKVIWRGAPIATDERQAEVDTIVQRLDDAAFNRRGKATTRIQVKALSLESLAPIETNCGAFHVTTTLSGRQPITRMEIFLEEENGGRYLAPLSLQIKLRFTPADRKAERPLELTRRFQLAADPRAQWAFAREASSGTRGTVRVDTDGDGLPETWLPRNSNFAPGLAPGQDKVTGCTTQTVCHAGVQLEGSTHCTERCYCNGVAVRGCDL